MLEAYAIPDEMLKVRPALQLAAARNPSLHHALLAEKHFWKELDRLRISLCRAALRPYVVAMGRENLPASCSFQDEHAARLACAEEHLEKNPVGKHGVDRMIEEARKSTAAFVNPDLIRWLPDVRPHFSFLTR